jgi:hypothetical protein
MLMGMYMRESDLKTRPKERALITTKRELYIKDTD